MKQETCSILFHSLCANFNFNINKRSIQLLNKYCISRFITARKGCCTTVYKLLYTTIILDSGEHIQWWETERRERIMRSRLSQYKGLSEKRKLRAWKIQKCYLYLQVPCLSGVILLAKKETCRSNLNSYLLDCRLLRSGRSFGLTIDVSYVLRLMCYVSTCWRVGAI